MGGARKRNSKKKKEKCKQSTPNPEHGQPNICNFCPSAVDKVLWYELYEKIKLQYQKVVEILLAMNYSNDAALRAILINGCMYGPSSNIFANILSNSISYIETGCVIDARQCPAGEPIFQDLEDAITCLMQVLINEATDDQPNLDEAIKDLLLDKRFFSEVFPSESCSESENESERLITESIDSLRKVKINSSALHQPKDIIPSFTPPKGSWDEKTVEISDLTDEVEKLKKQLNDTKMWAQETVIQAGKRLNNHLMELHQLRFEYQEKYELSSSDDMEVSVNEHMLRTVNCDLSRINAQCKGLGAYNLDMKTEISALQLNASENENALRLAEKEEKRNLRMLKNSEKKERELKRQIDEEKQNIAKTEENLLNAGEAEKDAKLRLMQETEAKKQARLLFMEEERLNKKEKDESRRRLEAVTQEVDAIKQQLLIHKNDGGSGVASSSRHSCLFCSKKMANVLFLPCRHQVICEDCYAISLNILANGCPCCKERIEKKIKVYV